MKLNIQITVGDDVPVHTDKQGDSSGWIAMIAALAPFVAANLDEIKKFFGGKSSFTETPSPTKQLLAILAVVFPDHSFEIDRFRHCVFKATAMHRHTGKVVQLHEVVAACVPEHARMYVIVDKIRKAIWMAACDDIDAAGFRVAPAGETPPAA